MVNLAELTARSQAVPFRIPEQARGDAVFAAQIAIEADFPGLASVAA